MMQAAGRSTTLFALLAGLLWPTFVRGHALVGRFYPEKQTYFVGEPVFIDFEITNTGDQPAGIDQRMGEPCIEPDPIEVEGAKHHRFGSDTSLGCFGGVAGSCPGGCCLVAQARLMADHGCCLLTLAGAGHTNGNSVTTIMINSYGPLLLRTAGACPAPAVWVSRHSGHREVNSPALWNTGNVSSLRECHNDKRNTKHGGGP